MNHYDLKDRVAVVTGARRGIGRSIALRLAGEGAKVAVGDVNREDCAKVVQEIERGGGTGLALKMDVTDEQEIMACLKEVREKLGRIDILVNNAGIFIQKDLAEMPTADIDRELAVDLRGVILCTKYVVPEMKQNRYGKIINIASIAGLVGYELASVYSASKGALVNMTKELALDLGPYRVTVNAVAPGAIDTPMSSDLLQDEKTKAAVIAKIPFRRIGMPEDIANAVAFLVSDESEYITGHTLVVDGGWIAA